MNKIIGLFVFSFLLLFGSCTFDKEELPEPNVPTPTPSPTPTPVALCESLNVTYSGTVVPLLNAKCLSCHGTGSTSGDFTSYAGVKAKVDNGSFEQRVIVAKTMPQGGPLPQEEIDKLQCWLDDGAPNN